jgi:hypothetical protein
MPPESEFDEIVLFELPAEHTDSLRLRLAPAHLAWSLRIDDGLFIAVALRVELDDLARLLRDVEAWLADVDLPYLTFLLDGREYELRRPAETLALGTA